MNLEPEVGQMMGIHLGASQKNWGWEHREKAGLNLRLGEMGVGVVGQHRLKGELS